MTNSTMLKNIRMSVALLGIAVAFIALGLKPPLRPFIAGAVLSAAFVLATIAMWRGASLIGLVAMVVVIVSVVYEPMRPISSIIGFILGTLGVWVGESRSRDNRTNPFF